MRKLLWIFLFPILIYSVCGAENDLFEKTSKSVIRISSVGQVPDYRTPWNPGRIQGGVGSGFVIDGNRILTNAHVVSNARYVTVNREGEPKPALAHVVFIAHDSDLALIKVEDKDFLRDIPPLELGGMPAIDSVVSVYGFPLGGERLSVTRGVVSRIDFLPYSHSGIDSHLTIQIDAAINPGNSGGPVLQDGKVIGVAFQGFNAEVAQNVGYMIPTPVVERFLRDIKDGKYDHYVDLSLTYHPIYNRAMRGALRLADNGIGVLVTDVYGGGSSDGYLQQGDVLLSIDGLRIASDGTVEMGSDWVPLAEVVERKLKNETVNLEIWRDQKKETLTIPLKGAWSFQIQANQYDVKPRYVIFGGLIFQPLDQNFMKEHRPQNSRLRYFFNFFIADHLYKDFPEPVVLSGILSDPINTYVSDLQYNIVETVNGTKINNLDDLAKAFDQPAEIYEIRLLGEGRPIILERNEIDAARDRILDRYQVKTERNLMP